MGKTTLLNALVTCWQRPEAVLAAAHAAQPAPLCELTTHDPAADLSLRPAYDALPAGAVLSREGFEAAMRAHRGFRRVFDDLKMEASHRAAKVDDKKHTLPFRGPFVSLPGANATASSFVPMLVDSSPDGAWHVSIRFRSERFLQRCVAAAVDAADGAAAPGADETAAADVQLARKNELFHAALGRDLLGFDGESEVPERLEGVPSSAWTISPWLGLFAGKTLRFTVAKPTWEEGAEAVHDFLLLYARDAHGLWAAIETGGLRVLAPADMKSPMLDLQGKCKDGTSRDMELLRTLQMHTPHSYIFIIHNEFPQGLLEQPFTREKVLGALAGEAAARAAGGAALEEAAPASLLAVRVPEKYSPDFTRQELLPRTTDPAADAEDVAAVRKEMQKIFKNTFMDQSTSAEHFSMIKSHAVTPTRTYALGMKELVNDLADSFKRAQQAECRRVAHAHLRAAQTALTYYTSVASATDFAPASASVGSDAAQAAMAARTQAAAAVLAAEKTRLATMCRTVGATGEATQLEDLVESVLLERVMQPLYEELRTGLTDASEAPFNLLAELDTLGIGPNTPGPIGTRCITQLTHLKACCRDSKVLAALTRPALDALARFGSTTLSLMAHGPRVTEEVSVSVLDELLGGVHPLAPLLARRTLNPADEHDRVALHQWLFVQELRLCVLREVGTMQAALAAISGLDLREAAICCGCTLEHFQTVSKRVLKDCGQQKTAGAYQGRNNMLAQVDVGPDMLRKVCRALAERIGSYFYDLMYASAERIKDACLQACISTTPVGIVPSLGGGGEESDADEGGLDKILRALQRIAANSSNVGGSGAMPAAPRVIKTESVIRDVVTELVAALEAHGVTYNTALVTVTGDAQEAPAARIANSILRKVIMRTRAGAKREREQWQTRLEELMAKTLPDLQALAQTLGVAHGRRKADLARRIAEHEYPLCAEVKRPRF
jgi:hypothetical protein